MRKSETLEDIAKIQGEYSRFVQEIRESQRLEDIEGFNDLSKDEQDYLRVTQGEAEFRMAQHYSSGPVEIGISTVCFLSCVIYSVLNGEFNMTTFCALVILIADLQYFYEYFREKFFEE